MFSPEAIRTTMEHRARSNALNAAVLESLPENPERGSYHWWARLCRQNTGQHFLDSGIAYGYTYTAPVRDEDADPIGYHFYDGKLDYPSINLPHFLANTLEADDPYA